MTKTSTDKYSLFERLSGELCWNFARSGGAGGQNVNKVSTKATGTFHIGSSKILDEEAKSRLRRWAEQSAPKNFSSESDLIKITCQETRSQHKNREIAQRNFIELFRLALTPPKIRIKTKTPGGQKRKRLDQKKRHSMLKRNRRSLD